MGRKHSHTYRNIGSSAALSSAMLWSGGRQIGSRLVMWQNVKNMENSKRQSSPSSLILHRDRRDGDRHTVGTLTYKSSRYSMNAPLGNPKRVRPLPFRPLQAAEYFLTHGYVHSCQQCPIMLPMHPFTTHFKILSVMCWAAYPLSNRGAGSLSTAGAGRAGRGALSSPGFSEVEELSTELEPACLL